MSYLIIIRSQYENININNHSKSTNYISYKRFYSPMFYELSLNNSDLTTKTNRKYYLFNAKVSIICIKIIYCYPGNIKICWNYAMISKG